MEKNITKVKEYGPFRLSMEVNVIVDDEIEAKVTYDLPPCQPVTMDELRVFLDRCCEKTAEQLGRKVRLMTKDEYWNMFIREKYGTNEKFGISGSREWDE